MNRNPGAKDVLREASSLGIDLTQFQATQLASYLSLLVTYNARMNLVGPSGWRRIFTTLVIDSLYLAGFLKELGAVEGAARPGLTLDLGAGAGLPGIPLRMLWHPGEYWLVEVRQRRCSFMRTALGRLQLSGTQVYEGRAEDVLVHIAGERGAAPEETRADLILSRAFMPWEKLLPFVRPLLQDAGQLIVLSKEMPPESGAFSSDWVLSRIAEYPVAGNARYFWALQPKG